jgi:hypothetical protein
LPLDIKHFQLVLGGSFASAEAYQVLYLASHKPDLDDGNCRSGAFIFVAAQRVFMYPPTRHPRRFEISQVDEEPKYSIDSGRLVFLSGCPRLGDFLVKECKSQSF